MSNRRDERLIMTTLLGLLGCCPTLLREDFLSDVRGDVPGGPEAPDLDEAAIARFGEVCLQACDAIGAILDWRMTYDRR
jgi:hypothetical protein